MIFVSDMGDALSRRSDFPFLKREVIEPHRVGRWAAPVAVAHQAAGEEAELAEVGGLPPNVCVMTTVTSPATLWRIAALRKVKAKARDLSLEPLWEHIPRKLNLRGSTG